MPVQDYNINTRNAVAGQVYGLNGAAAKIIESWELVENVDANDTLAYGEPVLRTAARACSNFVGVVADQDVAGFAVRQVHREINSRATLGSTTFDNESGYKINDTVAVLRFGAIQVEVAEAVVTGGDVFFDPTGRTYQATATTPTAYQLTNCVFDGDAASGEIVVVRILTVA